MLSVTEEAICRLGLSELAEEKIYKKQTGEAIDSAILELARVLDEELPHINMMQQGWREQISTRIAQE